MRSAVMRVALLLFIAASAFSKPLKRKREGNTICDNDTYGTTLCDGTRKFKDETMCADGPISQAL